MPRPRPSVNRSTRTSCGPRMTHGRPFCAPPWAFQSLSVKRLTALCDVPNVGRVQPTPARARSELEPFLSEFLNLLASGVALGAVYALGAAGFVLLFKATGAVNFAQGDLITLGAYLTYWLVTSLHFGPIAAGIGAIVLCGLVGVGIERVGFAPLRSKPHIAVIISTLGIALVIRALLGIWLGTSPITVPSVVGLEAFSIGDFVIAQQRLLIIVVTALVITTLMIVFAKTQSGRILRAFATDPEMAQMVGIRTRGLSMIAWGLSGAFAGLAGVMLGPLTPVTLEFGFAVMFGAFAAAVMGGFDSLGGVVVAGVLLGIVEQAVGNYVFREYAELYPFILMLAVLLLRPQGLFTKGAANARL